MHQAVRKMLSSSNAKRCHQCHGRFGLIRRTFALKQFCSKACVAEYKACRDREVSRFREWANFLASK